MYIKGSPEEMGEAAAGILAERAREVIFLAAGKEKLALAKKVLADPGGPLPAQLVGPATWIISGLELRN
ncbi:MAG: hypothetical protein P9M08_04910 [Candidatus Erginobacter occultus]|nr:hypothetical protein [Candidatus Erginobacter occultus]